MNFFPTLAMILGFLLGKGPAKKLNEINFIVSYMLLFMIGLKGGYSIILEKSNIILFIKLLFIGTLISIFQTFILAPFLEKKIKINITDSIVLAAQYGSISVVTFAAAIDYLNDISVSYNAFMTTIAAFMEIPAILAGVGLMSLNQETRPSIKQIFRKIVTCKSINLIFLGMFIGYIFQFLNIDILNKISTIFSLTIYVFMFNTGIKIYEHKKILLSTSIKLIIFGIIEPLLAALLATSIGLILKLSSGTILLFAILIASASYIAVPAVMKSTYKNIHDAVIFPVVLGITLPFNVIIVTPLIYKLLLYLN